MCIRLSDEYKIHKAITKLLHMMHIAMILKLLQEDVIKHILKVTVPSFQSATGKYNHLRNLHSEPRMKE